MIHQVLFTHCCSLAPSTNLTTSIMRNLPLPLASLTLTKTRSQDICLGSSLKPIFFHKVLVHFLYLISTCVLLSTIGTVTKISTLDVCPLGSDHMRLSMMILTGMVPMLLVSFGFLHLYYCYCHPWVSEGISAGFEPMGNGLWKSSDGMLNMILYLHKYFLDVLF